MSTQDFGGQVDNMVEVQLKYGQGVTYTLNAEEDASQKDCSISRGLLTKLGLKELENGLVKVDWCVGGKIRRTRCHVEDGGIDRFVLGEEACDFVKKQSVEDDTPYVTTKGSRPPNPSQVEDAERAAAERDRVLMAADREKQTLARRKKAQKEVTVKVQDGAVPTSQSNGIK